MTSFELWWWFFHPRSTSYHFRCRRLPFFISAAYFGRFINCRLCCYLFDHFLDDCYCSSILLYFWLLLPKKKVSSSVIKITVLNFFQLPFLVSLRHDKRLLAGNIFFPIYFFFYQITWKLNLRACIHAFIHNDEKDIVHLYIWKGWLSKAYLKNNGTIQEERKKERERAS